MAKIKDLNPAKYKLFCGDNERFNEYKNLLMNAVLIKRKDNKKLLFPVENYIKSVLIDLGVIGYDKLTDEWAKVEGTEINELGNPKWLQFTFENGRSYKRLAYYEPAETGAYRILGLPTQFSLSSMIQKTTEFMANCDNAIVQNIEACKTPYIVVCKNKDTQLSLEHAIQQKQNGQAVIIVSEELGDCLKNTDISVNFMADKFMEIRDAERDKLFNKLGIMSANINKRERVQVGEVNATLGQCVDYIYLLIDTFNKQCESYDLPFEMSINASLEELYTSYDYEEQPKEQAIESEGI